MDTARQVLRFSIPGSVLLLHALGCYFVYRACQGVSFAAASGPVKENLGALVAILATIPIGFVVYQAYYLGYTPVVRLWPLDWGGRIVRADRGWQILSTFDRRQIETLDRIFGGKIVVEVPHDFVPRCGPWYRHPIHKAKRMLGLLEIHGDLTKVTMEGKARQKQYEQRWEFHWDVLRAILDISTTVSGSPQIKTEYTTLSDIYHALGATRTAIVWGWILAVVIGLTHRGRIEGDPVGSAIGLLAITIISLSLYIIVHTSRRRTWKSASHSLRLGLRWFFLRYADELASGLDEDGSSIAASLRTSLRNLVPSRSQEEPPPAVITPELAQPEPLPPRPRRVLVAAIVGVAVLGAAVKLTGAFEGALDPDRTWVGAILLIPGGLACLAGFYSAGAGSDRGGGVNLFLAATGAFATIFVGVLLVRPTTIGGGLITVAIGCALLALAAIFGVQRRNTVSGQAASAASTPPT